MKKAISWLLLFLLAFTGPAQALAVAQYLDLQNSLYQENQATAHNDGNGQRVQKTVNGTVQKFLWNGSSIAKEYKADGTVRADYQLGAGALINGTWQFYLTDIQGSTLGVADETGKLIATWSYSDYGQTTQTSGSSSLYQPLLYTHCELDAETGFYNNRARQYAPKFGKFLARDPIASSNRYSYANSDPINSSDPSGLLVSLAINGKWETFTDAQKLVDFLQTNQNEITEVRLLGHGTFENSNSQNFYKYTLSYNDTSGANGYFALDQNSQQVNLYGSQGRLLGRLPDLLRSNLAKGAKIYFGGCEPGKTGKGFLTNILQATSQGLQGNLVYGSAGITLHLNLFGQSENNLPGSLGVPFGNDFYFKGWPTWPGTP